MQNCNHQTQDELASILHLYYLPQIGSKRLELLITHFGSATCALQETRGWQQLKIPSASLKELNCESVMRQVENSLNWLSLPNHYVLDINNDNYPKSLLQLDYKPYLLFVNGDPNILNNALQLAIVGSRSATVGGLDNAYNFAKNLAKLGFTITSGLAAGIDGASHAGTLATNGTTIAV